MTFKVLTDDTQRVICRSGIRSALDTASSNLRLDPIDGESMRQFIKFREDSARKKQTLADDRSSHPESPIVRPIIDPADLIGRSFLKDQDDGERLRFSITQLVDQHLDQVELHPDCIKYLCHTEEGDRRSLLRTTRS